MSKKYELLAAPIYVGEIYKQGTQTRFWKP